MATSGCGGVGGGRKKAFLMACGCFNPPTIMHLRMFGEREIEWTASSSLVAKIYARLQMAFLSCKTR